MAKHAIQHFHFLGHSVRIDNQVAVYNYIAVCGWHAVNKKS